MVSRGADLWHFTCEHSAPKIVEAGGILFPAVTLVPTATLWLSSLIWLTDLSSPHPPAALGLDPTRQTLTACDRTKFRFHVLHPEIATHWPVWRRANRRHDGWILEAAEGARPAHWFVSTDPVEVEPAFLDDRA